MTVTIWFPVSGSSNPRIFTIHSLVSWKETQGIKFWNKILGGGNSVVRTGGQPEYKFIPQAKNIVLPMIVTYARIKHFVLLEGTFSLENITWDPYWAFCLWVSRYVIGPLVSHHYSSAIKIYCVQFSNNFMEGIGDYAMKRQIGSWFRVKFQIRNYINEGRYCSDSRVAFIILSIDTICWKVMALNHFVCTIKITLIENFIFSFIKQEGLCR